MQAAISMRMCNVAVEVGLLTGGAKAQGGECQKLNGSEPNVYR